MNKTTLVVGVLLLGMGACQPRAGMSAPPAAPGAEELATAKTRFPEATAEQLKEGHSIYYGACTDCHKTKDISGYSEEELSGILDQMAVKAELGQTKKNNVWMYMITLRSIGK